MAVLFQIRGAYKSYGDQILLDNAEATITDDAKIGFVGRNGGVGFRKPPAEPVDVGFDESAKSVELHLVYVR